MSQTRDPFHDQQLPVNTPRSRSVFDAMRQQLTPSDPLVADVVELLAEREEYGIAKYGQTLMSHTGREPLRDAMEECLDLWAYLTQAAMEAASAAEERLVLKLRDYARQMVCSLILLTRGQA